MPSELWLCSAAIKGVVYSWAECPIPTEAEHLRGRMAQESVVWYEKETIMSCMFQLRLVFTALAITAGTAWAQPARPEGAASPMGRPVLRPRGVTTYIPSKAGGKAGILVRVLAPPAPRYTQSGAPVVIAVSGGLTAGSAAPRPDLIALGFVGVYFAFPGGGRGTERSGGTYDARGPNCMRALRDVILFSLGKIADNRGRKIQDLVGRVRVLTTNVGLVGLSHGGNACGAVMGLYGQDFPKLRWYVSWESPYGEGAVGAELGLRRGRLNPAYDPKTGTLDLSKLAFGAAMLLRPIGRVPKTGAGSTPLRGGLFFDMDGNGRFDDGTDFGLTPPVSDVGKGPRAWYSLRLVRHATKRGLFGEKPPAHIPTLAEAEAFWQTNDATGLVLQAVRKLPHLAVLVVARHTDHVQIAPDHPHISTQINAYQSAGTRLVRLNPDRAYAEWLLGKTDPALPDNDAGTQYGPKTIRRALCPDESAPGQLLTAAGVSELADRVQAGNFRPNLDAVLFAAAPKPASPPGHPPRREATPGGEEADRLQRILSAIDKSPTTAANARERFEALFGWVRLRLRQREGVDAVLPREQATRIRGLLSQGQAAKAAPLIDKAFKALKALRQSESRRPAGPARGERQPPRTGRPTPPTREATISGHRTFASRPSAKTGSPVSIVWARVGRGDARDRSTILPVRFATATDASRTWPTARAFASGLRSACRPSATTPAAGRTGSDSPLRTGRSGTSRT